MIYNACSHMTVWTQSKCIDLKCLHKCISVDRHLVRSILALYLLCTVSLFRRSATSSQGVSYKASLLKVGILPNWLHVTHLFTCSSTLYTVYVGCGVTTRSCQYATVSARRCSVSMSTLRGELLHTLSSVVCLLVQVCVCVCVCVCV